MFVLVLIPLVISARADTTISWANSSLSGDFVIFGADGITPLARGTDAVGCLVQLIYAPGGTPNPINLENDYGLGGTDRLLAYAWIGRGKPLSAGDGLFLGPSVFTNLANGSVIYMRAWDAPSATAGTGYIPSNPQNYGDSPTYIIANSGDPAGFDAFNLSASFSTSIPVPEPTTLALAFVGVGCFMVRKLRARFSSQAA